MRGSRVAGLFFELFFAIKSGLKQPIFRLQSMGKLSESTVRNELDKRGIELLDPYENYRTRRQFRCHKCHEWSCTAYDIIDRQHSCPTCGELTHLDDETIDEMVEVLNRTRAESGGARRNERIRRAGAYQGHRTKIEWVCQVDGHRWFSTPHDILFRGVGCPFCHVKSETIVFLAVKNHLQGVDEIRRQKFLCNYEYDGKTREATCDIYFKLHGKEYIIEYNGQQHYELVFFGSSVTQEQAERKLAKQQYRDNVVKQYCEDHDIELIVIDGRKVHGEKRVNTHIEAVFDEYGIGVGCSEKTFQNQTN